MVTSDTSVEGYVEKLGSFLKKQREAKNCSLAEMSEATKIRKGILASIEADDYTDLPPAVFVKGFLKSYAVYLGLDAVEIVKRYEEAAGKPTKEMIEATSKKQSKYGAVIKKLPFRAIATAIAIVVLVYAVLAIIPSEVKEGKQVSSETDRMVGESRSSAEPSLAPESPGVTQPPALVVAPSSVVTPPPPVTLSGGEIRETTAVGADAKKLNLAFKAREETWVGITSDGELAQVLLKEGDTYEVKAEREIKLKIGNAGGVDVSLNGKPLPSPGERGAVVKLTLTEKDLQGPTAR